MTAPTFSGILKGISRLHPSSKPSSGDQGRISGSVMSSRDAWVPNTSNSSSNGGDNWIH